MLLEQAAWSSRLSAGRTPRFKALGLAHEEVPSPEGGFKGLGFRV